jgi:hypothetical protein
MRQLKGKGVEGKEERGAHRRFQNRAELLADWQNSDEEYLGLGGVSG